jgi:hypothetical protein
LKKPLKIFTFIFDRDDNFGDEKINYSLIKEFLSAFSPKILEKKPFNKKSSTQLLFGPRENALYHSSIRTAYLLLLSAFSHENEAIRLALSSVRPFVRPSVSSKTHI